MKTLNLEAVRFGLVIAFLTLFMGVYLGLHFGKNEADIKKYLKDKATASSFYAGDAEKIAAGAKNGWKYLKRSHEHFQGLGAISVALMLVLSATWLKPVVKTALSLGIGLGGFVYPLFWYLVAYYSASIGKVAAKESLEFMALFGAGLYFISFLALLGTVVAYAIWKDDTPAFLQSIRE